MAHRIPSSSAAYVPLARVAAAPEARASAQREILDLLGHAHLRAHVAVESII